MTPEALETSETSEASEDTEPSETSRTPEASGTAGTPGDGPDDAPAGLRRRLLSHPVAVTTVVAALAHLVWFFAFANSGGDLAAQDAWAEFVGRHPDSAYNLAWYGGMHPVSYSIISPYVMSVFGVRTTMMLAGTASAALLALILVRSRVVRNPLPPALAGVFALLCNAASGRVTFGLGMVFGLAAVGAVFCWPWRWRDNRRAKAATAAVLAALATAGSPVAGLFVGVVAAALFLTGRRPAAYALGLTPVAVVAFSAWLFPFRGQQPMSFGSASLPVIFGVAVFLAVPRDWRTVRVGSGLYALGVLLTWLIDSQIGSNITRLAMIFAGVVLLAALPFAVPRSRKWYAILVAFAGLNTWIAFKSVDDVVHTTPAASWARELAPLVDRLQRVGAEKGRVEVIPARSHREASALAPYVNLARGWNRQADMERNPLFYEDEEHPLTSETYRDWLRRWSVHYVVLPVGEPDGAGVQEAELVVNGQPYLSLVWSDANWQLYEVEDPTPLADPPATVDRAGAGELVIEVKRAGRVLVRIPYSPWLGLVDEEGKSVEPPRKTGEDEETGEETYVNSNGCLMKAEEDEQGDEWTELLAPRAGTYRLAAPYRLPRGTPCPEQMRD
ncbi:MFS transporter [Streptomyces sp. GC420]|nr:MFS transporter [Streptomyces sp. GC420]NBM14578.1 MFS transporter [Streptomyces sp. GC420]